MEWTSADGALPATKCPRMMSDRRKLAPTAAIPISAPFPGIRLPKNRIRKNETAGNAGISHADLSIRSPRRSPFQEVDLVHVNRLAVPVDQDHYRQADPDLRRGHRDDEQGEHL